MMTHKKDSAKTEQENFLIVADYIFDMIDDGEISVSDFFKEDNLKSISNNSKLIDILEKEINFYSLKIGSKDVVFFVTGGYLKNAEGYAVIRNGAEPLEKYPKIGYEDTIHYEKITDRIYSFNAPLS